MVALIGPKGDEASKSTDTNITIMKLYLRVNHAAWEKPILIRGQSVIQSYLSSVIDSRVFGYYGFVKEIIKKFGPRFNLRHLLCFTGRP